MGHIVRLNPRRDRSSIIGGITISRDGISFSHPVVEKPSLTSRDVISYLDGMVDENPRLVVVMDNGPIHGREVREFLRGRGAEVVYLPRYSPDRSPAEGPWAVLKGGLCSRVYMDFEELGQDARRFLRSMAGRRDVLLYSVRRCGEPWTSLLGVTNLGL
ncbi:MAG: transposase [Conexivisphaera sp.]